MACSKIALRAFASRSCMSFFGGAVLLGFVTASDAQPSVGSNTSIGPVSPESSGTTAPGVIVQSSGTITADVLSPVSNEVVSTISVTTAAQAQTEFGVNRIYAAGAAISFFGVDSLGVGVGASLSGNASAGSYWNDVWHIAGELGTYVPVTVSGRLTGSINMAEQDQALRFADGNPISLFASYGANFGLASPTSGGAVLVRLNGGDFVDALGVDGTFNIPWSVSGLAARGYNFQVGSSFQVDAVGQNLLCRGAVTGCSSFVTFASLSTAKIDRIIVPDGEVLTASSGALVARDGYVTYAAAVPEPGGYWLMAVGLLAILARTAKPRRLAPKTFC